ncbi:unnamed protein product [Rotaria sp. Silwood1]|nr:unnamed protein product [Rotaria sp. Silwood1]
MLDSQICFEIIFTFERIIINGLDSAVNNVHREIFKVAKTHLYDRAMSCLIALINQNNFVYTNELEGNVTLDFRALDGSNNEVHDDHLITDDLLKCILNPIENAIIIFVHITNLIKQFSPKLKTPIVMFHLHLYELLSLISIKLYV